VPWGRRRWSNRWVRENMFLKGDISENENGVVMQIKQNIAFIA